MRLTSKIYCWLCVALLGFMLLLGSCSTDFDVNAPYDNMPVVYGLLNQNDTIHYIKINKTYLGEGNALVAATIPDSSIYQNLTAEVEEWLLGSYQRTFQLRDTLLMDREPGTFYSPEHLIYYFRADDLNEDAEYRLKIDVNEGNKTAESSTVMVKDFSYHTLVQTPLFTVDFHNGAIYRNYNIIWNSAENGTRYEARMMFTYFDVTATDTVRRDNEWNLGEEFASSDEGGEELTKTIGGESFYDFMASQVALNDANDPAPGGVVLKRMIGDAYITVTVAGEELDTYMEVNEPITGIVSERPSYSNISGGIGLFASRYQKSVNNKKLGLKTVQWLCEGPETGALGFCIDTAAAVWSGIPGCHCN